MTRLLADLGQELRFALRSTRRSPGFATVVAVLSHRFWQRQFGAASSVVGQRVSLDGERYVVVGVLSAAFDARDVSPWPTPPPDVWVPLQLDPNTWTDGNNLMAAARLRPGMTLGAAEVQTARATAAFRERFPGIMPADQRLAVRPLNDLVGADARRSLWLLFGSVTSLLLIVCANIACLVLVRAYGRARELAIRAASGASRGRLVRQLLVETFVLAGAGGALGLIVGAVGMRALLAIQPGDLPRIAPDGADVTLDWRMLLFTALASIASAAAFGVLPALRASRVDLTASLTSGDERGGAGPRHQKARAVLVIAEVALASMLLVGAALLVRSFALLRGVDPGFDRRGVLTIEMTATDRRFASTARTTELVADGTRALAALPEVALAAVWLPAGRASRVDPATALRT